MEFKERVDLFVRKWEARTFVCAPETFDEVTFVTSDLRKIGNVDEMMMCQGILACRKNCIISGIVMREGLQFKNHEGFPC